MRYFFTADLHLFHGNIIKYCNRPFKTIQEMHDLIRTNWNNVVRPDDIVIIVGDIHWGHTEESIAFLRSLNGRKWLIQGNHDKNINETVAKACFEWVKIYYLLKVQDRLAKDGYQEIILFHWPIKVWDKCHYGTWHLHGHCHGSLQDDPNSLSMDVGIDANNFTPVSYEEVKAKMATKIFKPLDHHGR